MSSIESPEGPVRRPWAYLITFSCYGTKLHGRVEGSVDRAHNAWKGRYLEPNSALLDYERGLLRGAPLRLDTDARRLVLLAIQETCCYWGWTLHAVHVRSNHVHAMVSAECDPEVVMGKLKGRASRVLNSREGHRRNRWTRHGSTVWLWEPRQVDMAISYVLQGQGEPMAVYENPARWEEYLRSD